MERYKGKRLQRSDRRSASELAGGSSEAAIEEEYTPIIARRKKFILIPMDEWKHRTNELIGTNDFFVFYNAQTNNINVLYKDGMGHMV
jgi:putative sigma-54 modulation protein